MEAEDGERLTISLALFHDMREELHDSLSSIFILLENELGSCPFRTALMQKVGEIELVLVQLSQDRDWFWGARRRILDALQEMRMMIIRQGDLTPISMELGQHVNDMEATIHASVEESLESTGQTSAES